MKKILMENFYDRLQKPKYFNDMKIVYRFGGKRKVFTIAHVKIEHLCGVPYGNYSEKKPKASSPLGDWCYGEIPRASMMGNMVWLGDMFRN